MREVTKEEKRRVVYLVETTSNPNEYTANRKEKRANDKKIRLWSKKNQRGLASRTKRQQQAKVVNEEYRKQMSKAGLFIADGIME
jgi:hypothetical protein